MKQVFKNVPDSISAALLLLSRLKLTPEEVELANSYCQFVEDWSLLLTIADRKLSLPVVYRGLTSHLIKPEISKDLNKFERSVAAMKMNSLCMTQELVTFQERVVKHNGYNAVYFKGPALSERYYDDPALRLSRDIDLIVPRNEIESLLHSAMRDGYSVIARELNDAKITSSKDIRALTKFDPVVHLVSPNGTLFEVHQVLDYNLGLFDSSCFLDSSETLRIANVELRVPNTANLLSYVCLHNTKHMWSHLHWLVDLDAIIRDPSFDCKEALLVAKSFGVRPAVEAAMGFNELSKKWLGEKCRSKRDGNDWKLLEACIRNLEGGLDLEHKYRRRFNVLGLPYYWPIQKEKRLRAALFRTFHRMKPSVYQLKAWPLPSRLHWLYYVTKPFFAINRRR